ncbi:MAG: L,D-transpeptidase [Candidatus Margulisbacteria bacterium]|nr:L,D-transpeptidase [Candidatus Margulisiibacteriota bacterium]
MMLTKSFFSRWLEFRKSYPYLAWSLATAIIILIIINITLLSSLVFFHYELKNMQTLMTLAEQRRIEAMASAEKNQLALAVELTKQMDWKDNSVHLAIDTKKGVMVLTREGAQLREMSISTGKDSTIGSSPDRVRLTTPLGKRLVIKVVDGSFPWIVPDWVYKQRGLKPLSGNSITGALGPLAIFLDSGTIIYTRPASGPLADDSYILPGSVRISTTDAEAIRKELLPGMVVYFY